MSRVMKHGYEATINFRKTAIAKPELKCARTVSYHHDKINFEKFGIHV